MKINIPLLCAYLDYCNMKQSLHHYWICSFSLAPLQTAATLLPLHALVATLFQLLRHNILQATLFVATHKKQTTINDTTERFRMRGARQGTDWREWSWKSSLTENEKKTSKWPPTGLLKKLCAMMERTMRPLAMRRAVGLYKWSSCGEYRIIFWGG